MQVVDSITKSAENRRRYMRLQGWDYSQAGVYFITVCTQNREHFFGEIVDGMMNLNPSGEMVIKAWNELPERFPFLELDARVAMPNHFHAIVIINRRGESFIRPSETLGDHKDHPYGKRPRGTSEGSIGRIVQTFKSITTHQYIQGVRESGWSPFSGKLWQRNYFEHIVRDYKEWEHIQDYIAANPINWAMDRENREEKTTRPAEPWQV